MTNIMREIVIDKVTINIGVGEAGERLTRASKVIEILTNKKPIITVSKKTIRDWNIRKHQSIGIKVTLRKSSAEDFLRRAIWVKDYKVPKYSFDRQGNLNFGIRDYTNFEGVKYNPEIGIFGMDVSVTFKRKGGYRVERRRIARHKIPKKHRVSREEAIEYMTKLFNLKVIEVK